jgi:hypothetical protein
MSKRLVVACLIATCLLGPAAAAGAGADQATLSCAHAVSSKHARKYVGRVVTVKGRVVRTYFASSTNGRPTFLDVGYAYPDSRRFSIVIWIEDRSKFGRPERRYYLHTVCVRGRAETYQGTPEIVLRSRSHIRVA